MPPDTSSLGGHSTCASERVPRAAIDAMVRESGAPRHDDGHTDCYYAGLLLAALPHLATDGIAEHVSRRLNPDAWAIVATMKPATRVGYQEALRSEARRALATAWVQKNEAEVSPPLSRINPPEA